MVNNFHKFRSNSKINLGLQVINKRNDGYHNISSLFIELEFHDILSFSSSQKFHLDTSNSILPNDNSNLICKAYEKLLPYKKKSMMDYKIFLEKNIPIGGGLGGGSSNAACTLVALNKLWGCNLSVQELQKIATEIGADVAFFINGGFQISSGIGNFLTPLDSKLLIDYTILLVLPSFHISTKWAYDSLNISLETNVKSPKFSGFQRPVNWQIFENDFERVIRSTYPEIDEIKSQLYSCGSIYAGMSGSGSTMFGIFDTPEIARRCSAHFPDYQTIITSPYIT